MTTAKVKESKNKASKRMAVRDNDLRNVRKVDLPAEAAPSTRKESKFEISLIEMAWAEFVLEGTAPGLLGNRFTEEDKDKMQKDQTNPEKNKKKKVLPPREPMKEFLGHCHICKGVYSLDHLDNNLYGFPAVAIKKSVAQICYSLGVTGNSKIDLVRFLFVHGPYDGLVPLYQPDGKPCIPVMRRDEVYLKGQNGKTASLAFRPVFFPWQMTVQIRYVPIITSLESLIKGLQLAGTFTGIGSWTNEHGGTYGMWTVNPKVKLLPPDFQPTNYR